MSESNKNKEKSLLVKSVLALDSYFDELERLGTKITSMDMKSESDFEQAQRLITRFAECGQGVSEEVLNLSTQLNEAKLRTEALAKEVTERTAQLNARNEERQKKAVEFHELSEKVRELSSSIVEFKRPAGEILSDEERKKLTERLAELEAQLDPLIQKAQELRSQAHDSKMKTLERNADSMAQSLQAVRKKIGALGSTGQATGSQLN